MVKKAVIALCSSLVLGCASMGAPRVPSLDCDDVIETERHGTVFYSCAQDTTDEVLEAFDLVGRVKEYGKQTFGFSDTVNYRQYVNTERQEPDWSYRLYVSPRNTVALESADDIFLSSAQEYRGNVEEPIMIYSRRDNLLDEDAHYRAQGYDTYRRALTDYSPGASITPDFLETPVLTTADALENSLSIMPDFFDTPYAITLDFFAMAHEKQIAVVNHEDWHYNMNQVWRNDLDTDLEESLATIIGHAGAIGFIRLNYSVNSPSYGIALNNLQRWVGVSEIINTSYSLLSNLYAQNLPWEETDPIKREILSRADEWPFAPLNNAKVIGFLPYTRLFPLAYDVYATHPDAGELGRILMQCPDDEEEGISFLRNARYISVQQPAEISFESIYVDF